MTIRYKFYGWFTDNDSRWKDATYIYSQNINTTNSEYIQVSPKARTMTELWVDEIDFLVPSFLNNMKKFFYVKDWKIYDDEKNLCYDHNEWQTKKATSLKGVVFLKRPDVLIYWNIPIDWNRNNTWIMRLSYNFQNNTFSLSRNYSVYSPSFEFIAYGDWRWFLYNWNYNIIDSTYINQYNKNLFSTSWISVWLWEVIYWQNIYWTWVKAYTSQWTLQLWDWVTDNWWIQDRYNLDLSIVNTQTIWWIDYIFSWRWLFYMNWTIAQAFLYRKASQYLNFAKFSFPYTKTWYAKARNFVFIPTKTDTWYDLNVLWQWSQWLPVQFSSIYSIPNCKKIIQMQSINKIDEFNYNWWDPSWVIVFYEKNSWWYAIDYYSLEDYEQLNDSWYIITKEYEWESLIFTKYARELKLYCDELKDNESLKIEASINWQDFFEVKTLTKNDSWKNGYYSILDFKREFHKIVFKLTLNWHFKLYDFVFYDNIKTT